MAILGGGAFRMLKNSVKLWVLIAILLIITSLFGVIASVYGNVPDHLLRIQEAGNNGDTGIALAESVTDETDTSSGTLSDPQSFFISTTDPATLNPPDSNSLFSKIDSFLDANRSVFLFFYADWCHFCKEQKPVIDDLEQEYSGKVAFVRINVDEKAQYCEVFEVTGYPTLILITGKIDGKYESEKLSGYTSKEKLTEVINCDTSRSDQVNLIGTSRAIKFEGTVSDQETQHSSDQIAINFCDSSQTVSRSELFSSYSDDVENFTVTQSTSYLEIMDYNCVGYDVYVNGVFQFTEGGDGYCGLNIPCAQDVTIELRKNGHSISKTRYVDCGVSYYWEITENWCAPSDVTVSDVKILRGEFVNKSFQPLETVDVVGLGDVFIIEVNVTNTGNETMNLYNLYYWELSPSNRVEIIGNASTCLTYIPLQSNKSASLLPFCLSQGFKAKETGWVTMNITVKDWNDQPVCEHTFDFEIVGGQCMDINAPGYYALTADIINSSARWCINITASNVIFEGNGHTVDGVDASNTCGVWVGTHTALRNVTIRNVTVTDWGYCGIIFNGVEEGRIERCTAASNDYGIVLFSSANNTAIDNAASSNTDGIYSFFSDNNTILHNFVTLNYGGIGFSYSSNNSVLNNNASGNYLGIDLYQNSNKNTIAGNIVEYNLHHGLFLDSDSTSNIINQSAQIIR
jgi:parallel beta-helix repeat protein